MRNANKNDEEAANERDFYVPFNVMFDSPFGLVHRKRIAGRVGVINSGWNGHVLMEEASTKNSNGLAVIPLLPNQLKAVTKGPSTIPRKPKNRPKKGTKPWTKIPYKFEDVEVGDIVVYTEFDGTTSKFMVNEKIDERWEGETGGASPLWIPTPHENTYILKPYKEPVKPKKEEVYRVGDRFEISDGYKVMLCRVHAFNAQLIVCEGGETGNRWSDRKIEIRRDSTVRAKDLLEFVSPAHQSIKKI